MFLPYSCTLAINKNKKGAYLDTRAPNKSELIEWMHPLNHSSLFVNAL